MMNANETYDKLLKSLVVVSFGGKCPSQKLLLSIRDWPLFIDLARKNKAHDELFHLVRCVRCRKFVKRASRNAIDLALWNHKLRVMMMRRELQGLSGYLRENGIKAVLFKLRYHDKSDEISGQDIDLLVSPGDVIPLRRYFKSKRYIETVHPPKEYTFSYKHLKIGVDVHTTLAYPHYGLIRNSRAQQLQRLDNEALLYAKRVPNKVYFVPILEHQLIIEVVRFWYNDLGQGLSSLFKIVRFIRSNNRINWKLLMILLHRYSLERVFIFVVYFGFFYLGFKVPKTLRAYALTYNVLCLITYQILPHLGMATMWLSSWHNLKKLDVVQRFIHKFNIADLLLDESVSTWRLVRPKIILFVCLSLARRCSSWIINAFGV